MCTCPSPKKMRELDFAIETLTELNERRKQNPRAGPPNLGLTLSRPARHRHHASCSWSCSPSCSHSCSLSPRSQPHPPRAGLQSFADRLPLPNVAALCFAVHHAPRRLRLSVPPASHVVHSPSIRFSRSVALSDPVQQPRMCTAETQIAAASSGVRPHAPRSQHRARGAYTPSRAHACR